MSSLLRWARNSIRRAPSPSPSPPMRFPTSGFGVVSNSEVLEEERFGDFKTRKYYPLDIGDFFGSKYQVVGKLGFGFHPLSRLPTTFSTAAALRSTRSAADHQTSAHRHVALKIYAHDELDPEEFDIYQRLRKGRQSHPGYPHVRTALDTFTLPRPGRDHQQCLVQKPMWDNFRDLLYRNPAHRFIEELSKAGLMQIFLALDYLHSECNVVHTDIKADNIPQAIEDNSILEAFTKAELEQPSPRKFEHRWLNVGSYRMMVTRQFSEN